eukprot:CAMPEP_0184325574 /NCGR_PEP_ID=MMETSP1049-20130417/141135_1 /TAXON_ID=77928 /ORGANISM="Proteomonas sulcata, Strain CCMP704" /LENGTH=263 /DNA_ID=CAMNT_0026647669 /DNA_START=72 /DNA_END=859 /DNA_ORIENTATION=+
MAYKSVANFSNPAARGYLMVVAGGPWSLQDCQLWSEYSAAVLACEAAEIEFKSCLLSGTGDLERRCKCGVSAMDEARIRLHECTIQHGTTGVRMCSMSAASLVRCNILKCTLGLALGDSGTAIMDKCMLSENDVGNLVAFKDSQKSILKMQDCTLGPVLLGGTPQTEGVTDQDGFPEGQWASEDRPGQIEQHHTEFPPRAKAMDWRNISDLMESVVQTSWKSAEKVVLNATESLEQQLQDAQEHRKLLSDFLQSMQHMNQTHP